MSVEISQEAVMRNRQNKKLVAKKLKKSFQNPLTNKKICDIIKSQNEETKSSKALSPLKGLRIWRHTFQKEVQSYDEEERF